MRENWWIVALFCFGMFVLFVGLSSLMAHLEYRAKWPRAKGTQLDRLGKTYDVVRKPGERDGKYSKRITARLRGRQ